MWVLGVSQPEALVVQLALVWTKALPGIWGGLGEASCYLFLWEPFIHLRVLYSSGEQPEPSHRPLEGQVGKTRARGPADPTLCEHWQLHKWGGAAPREQKALRHKWDTGLSGGQSQGSVAFIPLGADTVVQALKQSCGRRLGQGCWWRGRNAAGKS